jgi:hypothetical protein
MWRARLHAILVRPATVVGMIYLGVLLFFSTYYHYRASDFIHLGTVWGAGDPQGTWGYDGQFFYQIALHPLGAARFLDNAPFRYQRILYPLAVYLLSAGQAALLPYTLLLTNWIAIVFGVEVLSQLLQRHGQNRWFSLAYGLYFGQATAFTFDTAEPFTYAFVCYAIACSDRQQRTRAALTFGLAALARETAILFPLGYMLYYSLRREWAETIRLAVLSVLPLVIWLLVLVAIFGTTGLTFTPPFEVIPFYGIIAQATAPRKFGLLIVLMGLPTLLSGVLALRAWFDRPDHPLLWAWAANLALVIFLSRFSYLELIGCGRIATGLVLAGLAYGAITHEQRILVALQVYTATFVIYCAGVVLAVRSLIL